MRRRGEPDESEELNLIPIMNLVVCLIPMVLLGASLTRVGVVEVRPVFGSTCVGEGCPTDEPLDLAVHLAADQIQVSARGDAALAEAPLVFGAGDHQALYRALDGIKARHPGDTLVKVTAEPRVPYRRVIALMDVMRHRVDSAAEDFATAPPRYDAEGRPELLFPDVTFGVAYADVSRR